MSTWKQQTVRNKYIRKMEEQYDKLHQSRTLKVCLKEWHNLTIISSHKKVLQKKLIEFKKRRKT